MLHPEISDWTGFVRAAAESDRGALQSHLDGGCTRCRALVACLERVVSAAEIDRAVAPPARAVRSAKALFAIQQPAARGDRTEKSLSSAFDSTLEGSHTLMRRTLGAEQ